MNPKTYDNVLVEVADTIAVLTINRPEARNAMNRATLADLLSALDDLAADDAVGAVVITGAGDKAFVAGADITQLRHYDLSTGLEAAMQRGFDRVEAFPKPTIAAVNGFALGGGCELALACDIRIASSTARFGLPETNLSIVPGAGGTQRLARVVGTGRALEMILTGRFVDAARAEIYGLVTDVVAPEELLEKAHEVAAAVLAKGPVAVRLAKLVVRAGADVDLRTGLLLEQLAQTVLFGTADKAEGTAAFVEKRPPRFQGR